MAKYKITDGSGSFLNTEIDLGGDDGAVCEICHKENCNPIYDARTEDGGWRYLCQDCFNEHGIGLGINDGQKLEMV